MGKSFRIYVGGLLSIGILALILELSGQHNVAIAVSYLGTPLWILGTVGYLAIWDSRSRWPNTTAWQRFVNVMTFTR
jgi:hypothetical protein